MVGATDETTGQAVVAFLIVKASQADVATATQASEVLPKQVAEQIGPIARPRTIYIVSELPKTRSGKIMPRLLRDVAEGERSATPRPSPTPR